MKTTRDPYGPTQWSTTKNAKAENGEQYDSRTLLFWHFSGSLKWWGKKNRAMSQETNLRAFPTEPCLASYVTSGDLHLRKNEWALGLCAFSTAPMFPINPLHVPKKWSSPPSQEEPGAGRISWQVQSSERLSRGCLGGSSDFKTSTFGVQET